jgi:membrane peptidoglycan carboxypeptidase
VPPPPPQSSVEMAPETLAAIRDGLWLVVNGRGTGNRARIAGYDVVGKTGTAQVISNEGRAAAGATERDLRDNGWFVFFAPRDNPRIAGVVFGEHAEHGATAPAMIARYALETFFAKEEGRPLPPPITAPTPPPVPSGGDDPAPDPVPLAPSAITAQTPPFPPAAGVGAAPVAGAN